MILFHTELFQFPSKRREVVKTVRQQSDALDVMAHTMSYRPHGFDNAVTLSI